MAEFNIDAVLGRLDVKCWELDGGFELAWRHPALTPQDALTAVIQDDWAVCDHDVRSMLKKNEENWFYAELVFPEEKCGFSLKGTIARFFINGWSPFTLWVDGVEVFKEEHAWYATGPIADPFPVLIEPGKKYRLVVNFIPTELPADFNPLGGIGIHSEVCQDMAIQIGAAALQLRIASGLAKNDAEKQLTVKAAEAINLIALEKNSWDELAASLTTMENILQPFSARAKEMTVHCIGHTHIDMDWMWTWPDTVHCMRRDAKAITDMMDDFSDLTFTISQVPFYDVVKKEDPEVFAKLKKYIDAGRWECVAGTWVEGDLNMADGEDIARHMLYAKAWTKENLGMEANVFWAPDTFGHPGNMPQLVKLGGMDIYFHWRCNPGSDRNWENNWPVRNWVGVDGTPIFALSEAYGSNLNPNAVTGNILNYMKHGFKNILHIWGLGDHGGGLPRHSMKSLEAYRNKPIIPNFKYDTINNITKEILADESDKILTNKGETYSLFEGCFTTHASIKRYNRYCETALLTAESISALAGVNCNESLKVAWQKMLFNHFHDIFDGAAVHDSYINAHTRAEEAIGAASAAIDESLSALVTPTANGDILTLLNPLGFTRTEPVVVTLPANTIALKDTDGNIIPVQAMDDKFVFIATDVPALSVKSYSILNTLPAGVEFAAVAVKEDNSNFIIETNTATSYLHKESGVIGSYFDKKLAVEYVAYGVDKTLTHVPCTRRDLALNVFQIIDESHNPMSAWLINDIRKEENLLRGATVTQVETGPVFARFNVKHSFRASTICEDVIYYNDYQRVDFIANIDWREQGCEAVGVPHLKVSFGTTVKAARARFEGPFFLPERRADGTEQVTQKFLDISGDNFGYTIFNDSKYGVDALGGRARLSLLRNPYNPDPEPDNGNHTIKFAFAPHGAIISNSELVRQGMAYNRPNVAVSSEVNLAAKANLTIEGTDAVVCTSMRNAEYSDKITIRFFNASDADVIAKISIGAGVDSAEEVNFLERPTGNAVALNNGVINAAFHPFEVKTLLVATNWLKNII
jgi:alpha-mannosidase